MERPKWQKPSKYQLGFDFGQHNELFPVRYQLSAGWQRMEEPREGLGRFTRVVRDEVVVHSPVAAAHHLVNHIYTPFAAFDQEELWILLLNQKQRVTHEVMVYRGTVSSVSIRTAEVFKDAIRVNAPAILLSHIHPSGDPSPSLTDLHFTELALQAAALLGIDILDHIVVGDNRWLSMQEQKIGGFE
jgi:DNA repair protein RadC